MRNKKSNNQSRSADDLEPATQWDGKAYYPDCCDHGQWIGQTCSVTGNTVPTTGKC